jgi:hypothetical protein
MAALPSPARPPQNTFAQVIYNAGITKLNTAEYGKVSARTGFFKSQLDS